MTVAGMAWNCGDAALAALHFVAWAAMLAVSLYCLVLWATDARKERRREQELRDRRRRELDEAYARCVAETNRERLAVVRCGCRRCVYNDGGRCASPSVTVDEGMKCLSGEELGG